jgi:hypothetical protein
MDRRVQTSVIAAESGTSEDTQKAVSKNG